MFHGRARRGTWAIDLSQDAIEIGDMSALPGFMAQVSWRARGLYLMVQPQAEPPGSHWVGLGIERLTCRVDDLTYHVEFSHAHITIGTYKEGKGSRTG